MHSGGAKYDQTYYSNRRYQVQSYRRILTIDPVQELPVEIGAKILRQLSFKQRTRLELVNRKWREVSLMASQIDNRPVWVYIIFRKNHCSGHEKMTVNMSFDGPIFWKRQVAYIYCCSCHFHEHEGPLLALLRKLEHRVIRVCIVDTPVDYAFLPDSFFSYMARNMPCLQFIYLREIDLEKINRGTMVELAQHPQLKKLIVHKCRNYEVFEDFHNLPQLLVVKGDIVGLKAMIGDYPEPDEFVMEPQKLDAKPDDTDLSISSELAVSSEDAITSSTSSQNYCHSR
uniref:F-box domain-containing protein n=2 Tax=Loa loa TaxID=7209 RepID=A0A1I7V6G2_LOALO